jgi:hypothetical protein
MIAVKSCIAVPYKMEKAAELSGLFTRKLAAVSSPLLT